MAKNFKKEEIKVLGLSSLGGMLEFYDFIIFVFFIHVISGLFFPSTLSPFWVSINTYGTFAAGYFARPLGGIIMAHFGDKSGRKQIFILSILLMVIPTFTLGIMPTFETIGYFAPIILLIIRILQGIAIGGELPGAWVFVYEHSNKRSLGLHLGIFSSSVIAGILLGSIMTLCINLNFTQEEIKEYAWRIPFIIGGIFGIISLFLRRFLSETPVFEEIKELKQTQSMPIKQVFASAKSGVIKSFLSTWVLTGCIIIIILLTPNLLSMTLELNQISKIMHQIIVILSLVFGVILGGFLNDKIGMKKSNFIFSIALFITGYLFYHGIGKLSPNVVILLYYLVGFSGGVIVYTPIIMTQTFHPAIRYSGISFSYNISYAIFGGLTPFFFAWANGSGNGVYVGYYIMTLGFLAIILGIWHKPKY